VVLLFAVDLPAVSTVFLGPTAVFALLGLGVDLARIGAGFRAILQILLSLIHTAGFPVFAVLMLFVVLFHVEPSYEARLMPCT
jgi:hypothetical protein